jgi:glycosyltransferase involved in cell wall biosynthesis
MSPRLSAQCRRIALVTHGFDLGGGVPTIAHWLRDQLRATGRYSVDVHDLATSSRDPSSRRLVAPPSWAKSSLESSHHDRPAFSHWGANAVEFEFMRYRPRRELTAVLQTYDLVQVVAGSPAWGSAALDAGIPVALQVATRACWERRSQFAARPGAGTMWRRGMTSMTSWLERSALKKVDAVLVENVVMQEYVRSVGQDRVVKAVPGVDTTFFAPSPQGWHRDGYLLSVARLNDARKGFERLVQSYSRVVCALESPPLLVLAGVGHPHQDLLKLIADLGLTSRIIFSSNVTADELADLYRGASVFLLTSYEEGLGMSVLEAMSSGLPVVATDTAGTRESVIDGETGWLVPQTADTDVPGVVADRVLRVLGDEGATFAARARHRAVVEFSAEVALARFIDVYDSLIRYVPARS